MELPSLMLNLILLFSITTTSYSLSSNETDRLALLEFKAMVSIDPNGMLSSWNASANFCRWEGVTCGSKHQRVTSLNLPDMNLVGSLSAYITNLTFLNFLNLPNNRFHGEIPWELGNLFRLRYLNLSINTFEGEIPANISYCTNLRIVDLGNNNLSGKIPAQLSSLNKLVTLSLYRNNLTGEIPVSLGNLSSIQRLTLATNNLQGNIPNDLGRLRSLTFISLVTNNLTGTVPSTLYNLSSLTEFYVSRNRLSGSLPSNIGLTLPNLRGFAFSTNEFYGSIPLSFANASQLQMLEITENKLTGQVPDNLGYLKRLVILSLGKNFLGNNASTDLDFIISLSNCTNLESFSIVNNNFGGQLPISIGNISNLQRLYLGRNQFYGKIPAELGNLVNLYLFDMSNNLLSGPLPDALGKLVNLQGLGFSQNKLSGDIPHSLCNLTQLYVLDMQENKLEGNLSTCVGKWESLQQLYISANNLIGSIPVQILDLSSLGDLNLSKNGFTGLIPLGIGSLKSIRGIDMSENKLSGKIPETIGECLSLEFLSLRGNLLEGDIPSSLPSLKGLQELDLSRNNLSGNIPTEIENLMFLNNLNLSFNNLKGEIPKKGVFSNLIEFSIDGNSKLCGGIAELQLPPCPVQGDKRKKSTKVIILATVISSIVIIIAIISLYVSYRLKPRKNPSSNAFEANKLPQISYKELLQATDGFSSDNIIGEGSFGIVYKANLDLEEHNFVAVKVLKLHQRGASKSFLAECNALRHIRHRNLVKILTYCSSLDFKGNDFKALVFEFMENGSLEMWLHSREDGNQSRELSLLQRLQVAINVSSAIDYLHNSCETPIIHCDLKPSNILFDGDMTSHVSDFGLAKLLSEPTNESSQGETSSIGIKGTIGYMAPEYGTDSRATKEGDVYSFGIILLEIFTGRRPTDQIFTDNLNLHTFVKASLPGQVMQVLDPLLIAKGDVIEEDKVIADGGDVHKCIVSVLEIGLACSAQLSTDRMNMEDVTRKLNVITESFLRSRAEGRRQTVAH